MASFDYKDADVAAVFIRRKTGPDSSVLRRAAYNLITFSDGTSGIEAVPTVGVTNAGVTTVVTDFEVDRIEVYDNDPYEGVTSF